MSTAANGSCVRRYPITSGFAAQRDCVVKFSGSTLSLAGAGELGIGTLDERILSTDTEAAVRVGSRRESTRHRERSHLGGSLVYCAASGKFSDNGVGRGLCPLGFERRRRRDSFSMTCLPAAPLGVATVAAASSTQG